MLQKCYVQRWILQSMAKCTMSKLRHPKKCYVQDIGFFSVPEGHKILQPYIFKWFTAIIWTQALTYYYILYDLHFSNPWQQPQWSYKIGSVHLSICPNIGIVSLVLPKFSHDARNLYGVLCDCKILWEKKNFPPKLGKWTKNGPKAGFLNLLKNLVLNFY